MPTPAEFSEQDFKAVHAIACTYGNTAQAKHLKDAMQCTEPDEAIRVPMLNYRNMARHLLRRGNSAAFEVYALIDTSNPDLHKHLGLDFFDYKMLQAAKQNLSSPYRAWYRFDVNAVAPDMEDNAAAQASRYCSSCMQSFFAVPGIETQQDLINAMYEYQKAHIDLHHF